MVREMGAAAQGSLRRGDKGDSLHNAGTPKGYILRLRARGDPGPIPSDLKEQTWGLHTQGSLQGLSPLTVLRAVGRGPQRGQPDWEGPLGAACLPLSLLDTVQMVSSGERAGHSPK